MKTKCAVSKLVAWILIMVFLSGCNQANSGTYRSHSQLLFSPASLPGGIISAVWSSEHLISMEVFSTSSTPMFVGNVLTQVVSPVELDGEVISGDNLTISIDGKYIAFRIDADQPHGSDVSITNLNQDVPSEPKTDNMFVSAMEGDISLAWSPDNRQLAILRGRKNSVALLVYQLSTRSLQKVFEYSEADIWGIGALSWSSNGDQLAFAISFDEEKFIQSDIFIFDLENNSLARLTNTSGFDENYPVWYPKGKILTYTLTPSGGSEFLESKLVFATQDGSCIKSFDDFIGIKNPSWSPDGTQMAFLAEDGIRVFAVSEIIPVEYFSASFLCLENK